MQTAVVESSGAANPRVPVLKLRVVSLSPTFAGRDLTWCRLKSHMAEELLFCERPTNPTPVAKNGLISQHARLATKVRQAERGGVTPRIASGKYQVVTDCMSSEHFGQLAWQFERMSGSSGLKVQAAIAC